MSESASVFERAVVNDFRVFRRKDGTQGVFGEHKGEWGIR
jgi:hypothetical protein